MCRGWLHQEKNSICQKELKVSIVAVRKPRVSLAAVKAGIVKISDANLESTVTASLRLVAEKERLYEERR